MKIRTLILTIKSLIILLLIALPFTIYGEEALTRSEYIKNIVKLLGWEYKLPENPEIKDYVDVLNKEGFKIDPAGDFSQPITQKEKSTLINNVCNLKLSSKEDKGYINKATIYEIYGKVLVQRENSEKWDNVKVGMQLIQSDTIKTSKDSWAKLKVGMFGRITINENSEIVLSKLYYEARDNSESIILNLAMGEVTVDTREVTANSKFEVHTPTTVAAVRGTIYKVEVVLEEDHTIKTNIK